MKNSRPSELARELDRVMMTIGLAQKNSSVQFLPIDRLNTLVAFAPNPGAFDQLDHWIQRLDVEAKPPVGGTENYVFRVKYGRAEGLAMAVTLLYLSQNLNPNDTMTYSCALFEEGTETLQEAQEAKLELICTKLELEPGQRVLDIGCGWGSFAIHAAREHGVSVVGVTVSPPQAELARQRVRDAGLEDRVEIRVQDYREIQDEGFDAVVSIGMVEHVGEQNIDEYARVISRVLAPGGKVLNHGIVHLPWLGGKGHQGGEFSRRYVFPDGELLNLSRTLAAFESAGFETLHVEDLHTDYAETLRHWTQRLDERLEEAERLVGPERLRVWRLYLRSARNGFETAQIAIYQVLCSRPLTEPAASHPTGARHGEARRRVPTAAA
jgi:cyclopropane fatty-acyl-phospholipid synthase-like methyltransferase